MNNKKRSGLNIIPRGTLRVLENRVFIFMACSFLFTSLFTTMASAAINVSLSNQGSEVTTKSTGELLVSGNLTVTLWDSLTGGNLVYNETFLNSIVNGSWGVMLGENSSNPLPLEFGRIYYFDYEIDGNDVNFTDFSGTSVGRQFFYSPLGDINGSDLAADFYVDTTGNLTTTGTGFFGWLGSLVTRITGLFIQDINFNGTITGTGNVNTTGNVTATYFFGNGSQLTGIVATDIADGSVTNSKIAADAVNTTQIVNGTITDADISDSTNLTLGQKITFALGGFIQNIISGQIDINGTLNVTGGLNVDSGTLFVNDTNNRVGIGTTLPTQALDVNGDVNISGNIDTFGNLSFNEGNNQTKIYLKGGELIIDY